MRRILFILIALVGLVPLLLNSFMLVQSATEDLGKARALWVVAGTAMLLLLAAWAVAGWLASLFEEDLARFRNAIRRVARGNYEGWIRHGGAGRETRDLGEALNRMAGNLAEDEGRLEREVKESRAVATQSLEFIEELLRARVPLAKHHPGLVESYSRELVARKRESETTPEAQGFMREVMSAILGRKGRAFVRRRDPRYFARTLWLAAPVAARITDLSASGMRVESLHSPQGEDPRAFTIVNGEETVTLSASVRWCKLVSTERTKDGETVAVYRAGVGFSEDLPRRVRDQLLRTLDDQVSGS
jgi:hypothetical protein